LHMAVASKEDDLFQVFDRIVSQSKGVVSRKEWHLKAAQHAHLFDAVPRRNLSNLTREEWRRGVANMLSASGESSDIPGDKAAEAQGTMSETTAEDSDLSDSESESDSGMPSSALAMVWMQSNEKSFLKWSNDRCGSTKGPTRHTSQLHDGFHRAHTTGEIEPEEHVQEIAEQERLEQAAKKRASQQTMPLYTKSLAKRSVSRVGNASAVNRDQVIKEANRFDVAYGGVLDTIDGNLTFDWPERAHTAATGAVSRFTHPEVW